MIGKNQSSVKKAKQLIAPIICVLIFILTYLVTDFWSENKSGSKIYDSGKNFVKVINVGQGDSILIYSEGYSALIDTGISGSANEVCTVLDNCSIDSLDVLIITHLDYDHIGAIESVTDNVEVKNLILPEISVSSDGLTLAELAINRVAKSGGGIYEAVQGMNFKIGKFEITVLAHFKDMGSENNRSVVTLAEIEGVKFLLTGDLESKAEAKLLEEGLDLDCDVLKVGHHGSNTSSSQEFLNAVSPEYAAISVGADNSYGHPHTDVLSNLEYVGAKLYRTDRNGDITFYIENGKLLPKTQR